MKQPLVPRACCRLCCLVPRRPCTNSRRLLLPKLLRHSEKGLRRGINTSTWAQSPARRPPAVVQSGRLSPSEKGNFLFSSFPFHLSPDSRRLQVRKGGKLLMRGFGSARGAPPCPRVCCVRDLRGLEEAPAVAVVCAPVGEHWLCCHGTAEKKVIFLSPYLHSLYFHLQEGEDEKSLCSAPAHPAAPAELHKPKSPQRIHNRTATRM